MNVIIRPVSEADAPAVYRLRHTPGVFETTLGIPSARLQDTRSFLAGLGHNDHVFVAVVEDEVVGLAGLHVAPGHRMRHSATLGINLDVPWQGKGIGRQLMTKLLEVADQWLMLVRVELTVFTDNERAIALYSSLGFEKEGIKRAAAIREGHYADEYIMARLRNLPDSN